MKALKELEIRSPAGMRSDKRGDSPLFEGSAGFSPGISCLITCLATSFSHGNRTHRREPSESGKGGKRAGREMGFSDYRVRVCQGGAAAVSGETMASRRREPRKNL